MAEIQETDLATSNPLDATFGFPIFPIGNSLNSPSQPEAVGIGDAQVLPHTLFSTSLSLLAWKFSGSLSYVQQAGIFYGFGLSYTVAGETTEDGTATLTISDDDAEGGIGFGLGLEGEFNISLQQYHLSWSWSGGFSSTWEDLLNFEISIELDVIKLLLQGLKAAGFQVPLQELNDTKDTLDFGVVYGSLADVSGQFSTFGSLTLTPSVNISSDLADSIPVLEPLAEAVKAIGGELSFGPSLGLNFPITMVPARLITDGDVYEFENFENGVFNFSGGPVGPTAEIENVTVVTSHTIGLEFTISIQGGVELWTFVDISASFTVDLTQNIRIGGLGPFYDSLTNTNGGDVPVTLGYEPMPEVVWG